MKQNYDQSGLITTQNNLKVNKHDVKHLPST